MNLRKVDGSIERRVLTAMIVNDVVCSRISTKWDRHLFKNRWSSQIAEWCKDFYGKYGKAPGKSIVPLFEAWAAKDKDKDTVSMMERFLSGLSEDYDSAKKDIVPEHAIDEAMEFFSKNRLKKLADDIEAGLESGDLLMTVNKVNKFTGVELTGSESTDPFEDESAIDAMLADNRTPLFTYPGSAGVFFGDAFCRNSLVAILAPEKRGKSWWLMDIAWRALHAGCKVAMFSVGDMSQNQMMRRLATRVARRPLTAGKWRTPREIIPSVNDASVPEIEFAEKEVLEPISREALGAAFAEVRAQFKIKKGRTNFRLSTHANSTISVSGIIDLLKRWKRENGFEPDVIVLDYADILMMPDGGDEVRNQINATWKQLRTLSQVTNSCVVTATQADADGGEVELLTRSNFSEDKRKLAHVTDMFGLNQTEEEKQLGLYRLGWILRREAELCDPVTVAGCLKIANPCMKSSFAGSGIGKKKPTLRRREAD